MTGRNFIQPETISAASSLEPEESGLRAALDKVVHESLALVSAGLSALFALFAVSHTVILPKAVAVPMTIVASGTALALLGLSSLIVIRPIPARWSRPIAAAIAGLALLNSLLHLYLTAEPHQTTNLMLIALGVGCFFLSALWLAVVLGLTLTGWGLIVWAVGPSPAWLHFGFGLLTAVVLSVLVHTTRVRTYRRLERLRLQTEQEARDQVEASKLDLQAAKQAARQSEERLRDLFENANDLILSVMPDGSFIYVNRAWRESLGYSEEELSSLSLFDVIHPDSKARYAEIFQRTIAGDKTDAIEVTLISRGGDPISVEGNCNCHFDNGAPVAVRCIFRDVTEQKRAKEELQESEKRFRQLAENIHEVFWMSDPHKPEMLYISPAYEQIWGRSTESLYEQPTSFLDAVCPDDRRGVLASMRRQLGGEETDVEYRITRADCTVRWIRDRGFPIKDGSGRVYRIAGIAEDITERKLAEEQLAYGAFHDALTGLANRLLFMDRLEQALERAKRHAGHTLAVLFLDLDRFKVINDSLGHEIGDQMLVAIARRLEKCLRSVDTVARLGGDEFTILLDDVQDISGATHIADRVHQELSSPFNLNGHDVFTSASIGIALAGEAHKRPEDLLREADTAMYRAKALGKSRYAIFDNGMHARAMALLQLENDLRRAVERQELEPYYQPIVSLDARKVRGFEALVRWQHPRRGLIHPADFITLAEETGLIVPIGWQVLLMACGLVQAWKRKYPAHSHLTLSVNLSSKQFAQPDLMEQIDRVLGETGLDPHSLTLEITEGAIMENAEYTVNVLTQLRAKALQLHIDDFGTGYSSLSYLHRFPIHALKIDRSFISRIGIGGENLEIVRTIIMLADNLSMGVIAEGIESCSQLEKLRAMKCQYGQGYYFSRPLDGEAAEAFIAGFKPG